MRKGEMFYYRVGEENTNFYGSKMVIVEYRRAKDLTVLFHDSGFLKKTNYDAFIRGVVKHPYDKKYEGIGYLGEGDYSDLNIYQSAYKRWCLMLSRCYGKPASKNAKHKSYENAVVCEEWHNFQNFAKWYTENHYEVDGEKMCLDKDILIKNNKTYSPSACIFVPEILNNLFVKRKDYRNGSVIGTRSRGNKFISQMTMYGKAKYLGLYNTEIEAFMAYKVEKEKYIKELADKYKGLIPLRLYKYMVNYKVEIED